MVVLLLYQFMFGVQLPREPSFFSQLAVLSRGESASSKQSSRHSGFYILFKKKRRVFCHLVTRTVFTEYPVQRTILLKKENVNE